MHKSVIGHSSWPLFGYSTRCRLGLSKLASSDGGGTERHMFNNCSTVRPRLIEPSLKRYSARAVARPLSKSCLVCARALLDLHPRDQCGYSEGLVERKDSR